PEPGRAPGRHGLVTRALTGFSGSNPDESFAKNLWITRTMFGAVRMSCAWGGEPEFSTRLRQAQAAIEMLSPSPLLRRPGALRLRAALVLGPLLPWSAGFSVG